MTTFGTRAEADAAGKQVRKVDPQLPNRYVQEQVIAASLVGIDPEKVPNTYAKMTEYLAEMAPKLHATKEAKSAFRFLLAPPLKGAFLFTPARAYWGSVVWISFLSLPRNWRVKLAGQFFAGLPVLVDVQTNLRIALFDKAYGWLPPMLQKGPHMRAAEARLGLGGTEFLYLESNPRVADLLTNRR